MRMLGLHRPSKSNEVPLAYPDWIYNHRGIAEHLWAKLKDLEWRAVATRSEKATTWFIGVLCLAALLVRSSINRA
jgi:hypothetical protein